jgi:hypothetical protein
MNKTLVAAVGEHFVAYKLSCLGYIAAPVRLGSPATGLLASTLDGRGVVIQIKTTGWAERTRGRGANKTPHHLGFPLGRQPSRRHLNASSSPSLICMAVSQIHPAEVYIVPATTILKEYKGANIRQHSFFRHHRSIEHVAPSRTNGNQSSRPFRNTCNA